VLRAEITKAPSLGPHYAKILTLCKQRAGRQHKLDVGTPGARRILARERQWMVRSRDRDRLDAADPDALDPGGHINGRSGDANRGCAVEHHLRHAATLSETPFETP
jgi:hypothetical protein